MRDSFPNFRGDKKRGQSPLLVPTVFLVILIQNNPYSSVSYFGVAPNKGGSNGKKKKKKSACNTEDLGLSPGSGKSLGEGNGNPLQYSFLENSTEYPGRSMEWQRAGYR